MSLHSWHIILIPSQTVYAVWLAEKQQLPNL
jgi:hypothetical protein